MKTYRKFDTVSLSGIISAGRRSQSTHNSMMTG